MTNSLNQKIMFLLFSLIPLIFMVTSESYGDSYVSQIRLGVMKNDIHGSHFAYRYEKGCNLNGEILFSEMTKEIWDYLLNPKLHLGGSLNSEGYTSHIYTGFTWFVQMGSFVIEPTFGFDLNNGECHKKHKKRQRLGSNITFRESISLGYKISEYWTGYVMIDHVSHAGIFHPNPGLSMIGIRFGYTF